MAEIYLGNTKISSGASGGGSYDDTELREKVADLELYKPVYVTSEEYEAMVSAGTIDQNQMYAITDIADQNDIANFAKMGDITAALETLQSDLRSTADEYYVELSADLNSLKSEITTAKSTAVSEVQSQQTTSVSAVSSQQTTSVNAVKSQQTTSVNAVNSAQTTAVNEVNIAKSTAENTLNNIVSSANASLQNKIDNAPTVIVLTEQEYSDLPSVVENALYIIKPNPTE